MFPQIPIIALTATATSRRQTGKARVAQSVRLATSNCKEQAMGDKGGRKDKAKGQKQKQKKENDKTKKKQENQRPLAP